MNNSLLYVVRGNDNVIDDELFEGTAKAAEGHAEGHAAEIAFGLARDDNVHILARW